MPEEHTSPPRSEVIARSFAPEGAQATAAGRTLPEVAHAQESQALAHRLRDKYESTKQEDPLAALKQRRETGLKAIDGEKVIKRKIGSEAAPLTDQQGNLTGEGKRSAHVQESMQKIQKLEESGLEGFDEAEQQEVVAGVIKDTLDTRDAFASLSDQEKSQIARGLLAKPEVRAKLGEVMKRKLLDHTTEADPATQGLESAKAALDEKVREVTTSAEELDHAKQEARHLKRRRKAHEPGGKLDTEREQLKGEVSTETDERERLQQELAARVLDESSRQQLKEEVAAKVKRGDALTDEEEDVQKLMQMEGRVSNYRKLEDEKSELPGKLITANDKVHGLEDTQRDLSGQQQQLERAYDQAYENKIQQEESFVEATESSDVVAEGVNEYLDEQVEARAALDAKLLEEEKQQSQDHDEQRLITTLRDRMYKVEQKRHRLKVKRKKDQIAKDAKALILQGPKEVTRQMMLEPFQGGGTPEERAKNGQERVRIEERLKTDKAFAEQMQQRVSQELIGGKIKSGALFEGDIMLLEQTQWGKDAIDQAVRKDDALRTTIDRITDNTGDISYYQRVKSKFGGGRVAGFFSFLATAVSYGVGVNEVIARRMKNNEMGHKFYK